MRGTLKHAVHRMKGSLGLDYYGTCYGPWKIRLRSKGFEMVREEGMAWMPFSRSSDSPLVTPFVGLERHLGLGRLPGSQSMDRLYRPQICIRVAGPMASSEATSRAA